MITVSVEVPDTESARAALNDYAAKLRRAEIAAKKAKEIKAKKNAAPAVKVVVAKTSHTSDLSYLDLKQMVKDNQLSIDGRTKEDAMRSQLEDIDGIDSMVVEFKKQALA